MHSLKALHSELFSVCALAATISLGCKSTKDCPETQPQQSTAEAMGDTGSKPTPPASVDVGSPKQLRLELAETVLTPSRHQQIIQQSSAVLTQAIQASGQPQPDGLKEKLDRIVAEALPYREVLAIQAKIYGQRFTTRELGELLAFYKTKTGAKLLKELPGITQDLGTSVSKIVQRRWPSLARAHGLEQ